MKDKRLATAALALSAAVLLGTAACSPDYPDGPSGTVTDRSAFYRKADGWHFKLTTSKTFRVTRDEYRHCFHGSSYPKCTGK